MLWRAVLTAIAISYLICVLWLSGLQKEDLDVNMLRKLQRYNVNIDDLNRDQLQEDCMKPIENKDNRDADKNIRKEDEDTTAATTSSLKSETTTKIFNQLELNNFSTLLEKLMNEPKPMSKKNEIVRRTTVYETNTEVFDVETDTETLAVTDSANQYSRDIETDTETLAITDSANQYSRAIETDTETLAVTDSANRYSRDATAVPIPFKTIANNMEILIDQNQTNIEKVLSFWKMFSTPRPKHSTVPVIKTTRAAHRVRKKKHRKVVKEKSSKEIKYRTEKSSKEITYKAEKSSKEMKHMTKLLANYFYEKMKSSTTPAPITSTADLSNLNKLTQQFDKFFKLFLNKNEQSTSSPLPEKVIVNSYPKDNDAQNVGNNMPQQALMVRARNNKYVEANLRRRSVSDISALLLFNDQLKKSSMVMNETNSPPYPIQYINSQMKHSQYYELPEVRTTACPPYDAKTYAAGKEKIKVLPKTVIDTYAAGIEDIKVLPITVIDTNTPGKEDLKVISKTVIDEIAENIKAKILKDLRQEITSTTIGNVTKSTTEAVSTMATTLVTDTTTSATTTVIRTTESNDNKTQETSQVLKNIMELLKDFQILKGQASSSTASTQKLLENKDAHISTAPKQPEYKNTYEVSTPNQPKNKNMYEVYNNPLIIGNNLPIQVMNTDTIKTSPGIAQAFEPQIIREYDTPNNNFQSKYSNIKNALTSKTARMRAPHIIQTNSDEVPPLGIPMPKPSRLIHQNIVVTTAKPPLRILHSREQQTLNRYPNSNYQDETRILRDRLRDYREYNRSQYISSPLHSSYYDNQPSIYSFNSQYNPQYRSYVPQHNSKPSQYDSKPSQYRQFLDFKDSYREPTHAEYMSRPRTIEKERSNYSSYTPRQETVKSQLERKYRENLAREAYRHYNDNISATFLRNRDSGRFHERLERADDVRERSNKPSDVEKCCSVNVALASRQQQAVNTMKSRYDDTHFNNFLRTQQKVNDMLEQILATKTYTDDPRSVEVL